MTLSLSLRLTLSQHRKGQWRSCTHVMRTRTRTNSAHVTIRKILQCISFQIPEWYCRADRDDPTATKCESHLSSHQLISPRESRVETRIMAAGSLANSCRRVCELRPTCTKLAQDSDSSGYSSKTVREGHVKHQTLPCLRQVTDQHLRP